MKLRCDLVAQLVEQLTLNQWVESSSLSQVTQRQMSDNLGCLSFFVCYTFSGNKKEKPNELTSL